MKNILKHATLLLASGLFITSCSTFGRISLRNDIKTFEVREFTNKTTSQKINLQTRFSEGLEDHIFNQTNLDFVTDEGDIIYEGEIIYFEVTPNNIDQLSNPLENRLTITVRLRFFDTKNSDNNLVRSFTSYYNFDNELTLLDIEEEAYTEIFKNIHQDIVKETISRW